MPPLTVPTPRRLQGDDTAAALWRSPEMWAQIGPALVAVLAYIGALANGFAYDDLPVILNNDWIRHGTVLTQALILPYWPKGALFRPLTSFSYGIDWMLGGGRPLLFHAVNMAWYAVGTALVARVALRWWPPLAAACAALLFALHPVHVESVANVVGRAELLAGAALLALTLVASAPRPLSRGRLFGVAVLAALALAAKETGVVAPVIAWAAASMRAGTRRRDAAPRDPVADGTSDGEASRDDVRRTTCAALLGVALVLFQRLMVLGTLAGDTPHAAFVVGTARQSVTLALATVPRALALMAVPQWPRVDYSPTSAEITHPSMMLVALGALLTGLAVAAVIAHARRPSRWTWAAVFSIATFAPVSNLVLHTGVVLADRTLYSPSVGACIVVGGAVAALWVRRRAAHLVYAPLALAGAALVVAGIYTVQTVGIWRDNQSVFSAMRDRAPMSYRGYFLLATERRKHDPPIDAHRDYVTAISLFDGDPALLYDAAINALTLRDTSDALRWLRAAVERSPSHLRARTALVLLDIRRCDVAPARALLRGGLALQPDQHLWQTLLDSLDHESRGLGAGLIAPANLSHSPTVGSAPPPPRVPPPCAGHAS